MHEPQSIHKCLHFVLLATFIAVESDPGVVLNCVLPEVHVCHHNSRHHSSTQREQGIASLSLEDTFGKLVYNKVGLPLKTVPWLFPYQ